MPLRSCAGCGVVLEKKALLRFTLGLEQLLLDLDQQRGGRGVYICNAGACLDEAVKRGRLSYRLRKELGPIDGQVLKQEVTRQIQEALFGVVKQTKRANELRAINRLSLAAPQPAWEGLALICPDVSANRMKRLSRFCRNRGLPFGVAGNKEQFLYLTGRGPCSLVILKEGPAAQRAKELLLHLGQLAGGASK